MHPLDASGDRFALAGIDDPREARRFFERLQFVVARNDRITLGGMLRYPFTIYERGKPVRVYGEESALSPHFDRVFTPKVLQAIRDATFDSLFVNWQGVMIGGGEVWFDKTDGEVKIKAVNT